MLNELANHLWQSTVFSALVWLLTLALRRNRARVRHGLWLAASVKFLIPFSALIALGGQVAWRKAPARVQSQMAIVANQVSEPFDNRMAGIALPHVDDRKPSPLPAILLGAWAMGFVGVGAAWLIRWRRIRAAVHAGSPIELGMPIRSVSSPARLEPGVFGVFRPVLLLPSGIAEKLTREQFDAVIEHELCHVRHHDNLTAAIHMLIETVFWFHPLVWWVGTRLVEERERACDEEVLRLGSDPRAYAQSILRVCELYVESPLACVAGVSGSGLKKRIEAIMNNRIAQKLTGGKKLLLASAGMAALAGPILIGMVNAPPIHAQTPNQALPSAAPVANGAAPKAVAQATVAQIAPQARPEAPAQPAPAYLTAIGSVAATTVTIRSRVDGQLMSVDFKEGAPVEKGQLLATIDSRPYQTQVTLAQAQLSRDEAQLAAARQARAAGLNPPSALADIEGAVKADQANLESAQIQLNYTQIRSPISGVAGLLLVDPGNIVRAADSTGIVVISQLQPIAVVFNLPESELPPVLARVRAGVSLTVDVWNSENTARIATGRLTAVDNQIDPATGTAKLKAEFDNNDNSLFPNQFVNARLLVNAQ